MDAAHKRLGGTHEFYKRRDLLDRIIDEGISGIDELILYSRETARKGGRIFFAGNGGSAADAQHLAAEYIGAGLAAIALTTDTSVLTALGNDYSFEEVFSRQLAVLGKPGDLLIVHSTSGESENVIRLVREAGPLQVTTVGLTARGGGTLAKEVDVSIVVPTDSVALAQEVHLVIGHITFEAVLERLDA